MLEHELAPVIGLELRAMSDADHGRIGDLLIDELQQLCLAVGVERRGGFIHHNQVRAVNEQAGEGEPLLFAA